jgi:hypothetical protein
MKQLQVLLLIILTVLLRTWCCWNSYHCGRLRIWNESLEILMAINVYKWMWQGDRMFLFINALELQRPRRIKNEKIRQKGYHVLCTLCAILMLYSQLAQLMEWLGFLSLDKGTGIIFRD